MPPARREDHDAWRSRRRSARPARGGRCPVPRPATRSPHRRRGGRPPPRVSSTRPCSPDEDSGTCSSFSIFSAAPGRPPRRPGRAPGPRAGWAPPRHTACSRRVRSRPATLMRTSRPVARSSRIACAPSAAGPAPAATADRTAAVLDSSRAGAAVCSPSSARSRTVRVPDPGSRTTSGVAARVAAVTRRPERWAHGWPGPTTTTSVSVPTRRCCRSSGASGPSTKPRSTSPAATSVATRSLLVAVMVTSVGTWPSCACRARSATSQPGSRCSAMVRLAAMLRWPRRSARSAAMPASSCSAASSTRPPTAPAARRSGSAPTRGATGRAAARPTSDSMVRTRDDAACWVMPSSAAAALRLPVRATTTSSSSARSSGTWDPSTRHKVTL